MAAGVLYLRIDIDVVRLLGKISIPQCILKTGLYTVKLCITARLFIFKIDTHNMVCKYLPGNIIV